MSGTLLETYLTELAREMRKHGLLESGIVQEVRDHLVDAAEAGLRRGLDDEAATQAAIERFGAPRLVAAGFADEKHRVLSRVLFAVAVSLGLAIAYVDSRPTWDDTGITAFSMLLSAALLGLVGPRRPWLWALAIGVWIPLHQIARTPTLATVAGGSLILAFPAVGAFAGMYCRRAFARVRSRVTL